MKAQMETAAERYRRIKAERLKDVELFDFESPSGMTWQLRKPDLGQFVTSGIMPISLAAKVAKRQSDGGDADPANIVQTLTETEFVRTIEFSAKVVRYCAVSPRIVETPTPGADEISYEEVEMDDFNAIFAWAMPGGGKAESLDTFPSE